MEKDIMLYNVTPVTPQYVPKQDVTVYVPDAREASEENFPFTLVIRDNVNNINIGDAVNDTNAVNLRVMRHFVESRVSSTLKYQGTITYGALISKLTVDNVNKVWNVVDAFVTSSNFIEGEGNMIAAGTNVAVVDRDGLIMFDLLGSAYPVIPIERW
jgi:hypothetical protein